MQFKRKSQIIHGWISVAKFSSLSKKKTARYYQNIKNLQIKKALTKWRERNLATQAANKKISIVKEKQNRNLLYSVFESWREHNYNQKNLFI
jgi:hypothetical protein